MRLDDYGPRFRSLFKHEDYRSIDECVQEIVDYANSKISFKHAFRKRIFNISVHGQYAASFTIKYYIEQKVCYIRIGEAAIRSLSEEHKEKLKKLFPPLEDHGKYFIGTIEV